MKGMSWMAAVAALALSSCAEYSYQIRDSHAPVSFAREAPPGEKGRPFTIQRKITFVLFDLANTEKFDLGQVLRQELPNAKLIYDLEIHSEEDSVDSVIRTVTTFLQIWALVSDRPLVSRRTIRLEGMVIDHPVKEVEKKAEAGVQ